MLGIEQFISLPNGQLALGLIIIWSLIWKGLALWKAARNGSKSWFIILLVLNTLGILEIIYIFAVKPKVSLEFKNTEK
ncbi:MAG: hypothetical protein QG654_243 [Patescibacteria group bacterium]|jgi:hypothetical protein|nr:hypothetical protein [Patescibacteria group bacterium]